MTPGAVVVDLRAVQSPDHRGRGIGRWVTELAAGLERVRPDLVGAYLLDPAWPPPGRLERLLGRGKLCYLGSPRANAALEAASVYHCASPFELRRTIAEVRPPIVDRRGLRYTVSAYDLIPLRWQAEYLADPKERRRYMARLEVLRSADAVLAISAAAESDVVQLLGVAPARCIAVGTGVSRQFGPPRTRAAATAVLRSELPEVTGPFVLFPGGNHPRKNAERLMAAFAALPDATRAQFQLVVTGDFPDSVASHYRQLARQDGLGDRMVLTGFVAEETLVHLYQATTLVAFPSLAEGFGLPVAEGLACGAVACVSDRPPLDELVPDGRARFDPERPADIAATMLRCLTDESVRQAVRSDARSTVVSWDTVAGRVATALGALAGQPRRPWKRRRPARLAVVSPFPPVPSGISGYSANLVASMERVAGATVAIDCFVDGRNRFPAEAEPIGGRRPRDAALFERVDGAIGGYDHVLYVLGNSEYHSNALAALRRRSGTVLAHEVRLSGLLSFSRHTRGAVRPGGLAEAVARNYPGLPAGLGRAGTIDPLDAERFGLLLLKDVAADAERVLLFSEAARRLALLDVGPQLAHRIGVVPYAVTWSTAVGPALVARDQDGSAAGEPLVASFGIVDPSKRPETLIEAVAVLATRGVHVRAALVGPVSTALGEALGSLVGSLGVSDRVTITGEVPEAEYLRMLGQVTVAVQLRDRFSGECSGTVSECLTLGIPTVVASIGWMAEIPAAAALAVPPTCGAEELADALAGLLSTASRRQAMGQAGRRWAQQRTFDAAAAAVLEDLEASAAQRPWRRASAS